MTTTPQTADRRKARRGFTLTELMVVTTLIGVMAAMSVPSFQHACEQSRADIAAANLRAIWAAERLFWLENHTYTDKLATQTSPLPPGLADLGLIDSEIVSSTVGYVYLVPAAGTATFTATATRKDPSGATFGFFRIDQTGSSSGTVSIGGATFTPGFQ
jgi:prepilin-type N-terminal cleavage/methylation domain-containing protein